MRVGFIGTGTMGTPIAGCLMAAGHQLTVYDIRHEATLTLQQHGAAIADTPRAVAQASEAVFTSLPGPSQVEAAALDPETGLIAGLPGGGAYIDLTTNALGTIRRLAAACQQRGIDFLDAPVSGRPPAMTVMAGGDAAVFARCRPLLEAIAKNVFHVGANGAGCVAKLVTQYLGYTNFIAALEGMLVAAKAGIDLGILAQIVPVSAGQSRTFDNIPRSVLRRVFRSSRGCWRRWRRWSSGRRRAMNDRPSEQDTKIARLLLTQEVAEFLYREAELLDERRYDDWLGLLADDIRYWMPMRRNVKFGEEEREFTRVGQDIAWFDEGKDTLVRRVRQIQTGIHWAEEPVSRISHLVTNVQLVEATPSAAEPREVTTRCRFLVYRNRVETETDILVGKREDVLRREGEEWRIARRTILLDQNVLLSKNLTFFF